MAEPFIGQIKMFGFGLTPKNWAQCDGQPVSVFQNGALYSLLGLQFGGDNKVFKLPDLRGRVPVGTGTDVLIDAVNQTVIQGEKGGSETNTLTVDEMPSHTHNVRILNKEADERQPYDNYLAQTAERPIYGSSVLADLVHMSSSAIGSTGEGKPFNNVQPSLVLNFCIALQGAWPQRP